MAVFVAFRRRVVGATHACPIPVCWFSSEEDMKRFMDSTYYYYGVHEPIYYGVQFTTKSVAATFPNPIWLVSRATKQYTEGGGFLVSWEVSDDYSISEARAKFEAWRRFPLEPAILDVSIIRVPPYRRYASFEGQENVFFYFLPSFLSDARVDL